MSYNFKRNEKWNPDLFENKNYTKLLIKLLRDQNFVFVDLDFLAAVWNVEASVTGLHLAGCLCALMETTTCNDKMFSAQYSYTSAKHKFCSYLNQWQPEYIPT